MLEIRKSRRAEADLIDIWGYTFETWGERQADRYHDKLAKAFAQLSRTPNIGAPRDGIRPGLRALHAGSHVVYYYVRPDHIYIIRIRHDRSDPWLYEE